jgi:pyruvate dehydrogenase E2 component (dihydrolipoamide acetyltransferase)
MVVKATALSLKQHPKINSSWLGDSIRTNHHVNHVRPNQLNLTVQE